MGKNGQQDEGGASEVVSLDPDDLTMDEMEQVEEILQADLGITFDQAFGPGQPRMRFLKYVALVKLRQTNPDLTIADVGRMRMSQFAGAVDAPGEG